MSKQEPKSDDLASRLFSNAGFSIPWVIFLAIVMKFVSWPIRDYILVCWIYGRHAYFQDGIHVVSDKPTIFSNGVPAPTFPNLATGFGAFIVTVLGLTFLMILALRFYERHFIKN